jgi:hypothetical protein
MIEKNRVSVRVKNQIIEDIIEEDNDQNAINFGSLNKSDEDIDVTLHQSELSKYKGTSNIEAPITTQSISPIFEKQTYPMPRKELPKGKAMLKRIVFLEFIPNAWKLGFFAVLASVMLLHLTVSSLALTTDAYWKQLESKIYFPLVLDDSRSAIANFEGCESRGFKYTNSDN